MRRDYGNYGAGVTIIPVIHICKMKEKITFV